MKPCDHDSREHYGRLIGPMRTAAALHGYALAVHGSLRRDIDLIAVPWAEDARPAEEVAEAIREAAAMWNGGIAHMRGVEADDRYHQLGQPGAKPWGRRCWSFHLGGGPYIDLSVMPRTNTEVYETFLIDEPAPPAGATPGEGSTEKGGAA